MICETDIHTPDKADPIQAKLVKAIERKETSYLWTPGDTKPFIPRVLPTMFGDGRALLAISTLNQRPAYWVVRICSTWGEDIGEHSDDILTALEEAFGRGRCGYSGNNLFQPKRYRILHCKCEECSEGRWRARWPMVDDDGGCSWGLLKWPEGFDVEPHPKHWRATILRTTNLIPAGHTSKE